jgi:hypothetical protein
MPALWFNQNKLSLVLIKKDDQTRDKIFRRATKPLEGP